MKISIIIPIYNEENTIKNFIKTINDLKNDCEIIFVDGGSSDNTLQLIPDEFCVYKSPKGRANQMNFGAKKSTGDVLFFLHCDSILPREKINSSRLKKYRNVEESSANNTTSGLEELSVNNITSSLEELSANNITSSLEELSNNNIITEIEEVMENYDVGCFGVRFNSKSILMKICGVMSNIRVKYGNIAFGDQGIFIKRELFFEIGGFPDLRIMEDYQFSLNLKRKCIKIGMTKNRITTSERRFLEGGRLRVMWKMQYLRFLYRHNIDINRVSNKYNDIR
ncbi:MAG: glycosyltransferase family 2 protein [Clostridioides sp.]|jgi:glycosyltransferase involved in cell wall biosynthesis|nr:glycosyltransferase family 2 protein [Clostridioides sp.]